MTGAIRALTAERDRSRVRAHDAIRWLRDHLTALERNLADGTEVVHHSDEIARSAGKVLLESQRYESARLALEMLEAGQ